MEINFLSRCDGAIVLPVAVSGFELPGIRLVRTCTLYMYMHPTINTIIINILIIIIIGLLRRVSITDLIIISID